MGIHAETLGKVRAQAAEIAAEHAFARARYEGLMNDAFEDGASAAENLKDYLKQHGQARLLDNLDRGGFEKFGSVVRASLKDRLLLSQGAIDRHEASQRARQELPPAIRDMLEKGARRDEATAALRQAELAAEAERRQEEAQRARTAEPAPQPDPTDGAAGGRRTPHRPREPSAPISRNRGLAGRVLDWSSNFAERQTKERGIDPEELRAREVEREKAREQAPTPSPSRSGGT